MNLLKAFLQKNPENKESSKSSFFENLSFNLIMFENCPLCHSSKITFSEYFTHCGVCDLIFRAPVKLFIGIGEKEHYLMHQNGPQYDGYVSFLKKAIDPIKAHLKPNLQALDFGCGPGPAIDFILQEYQISCDNYDPFFFPDGIKSAEYDIIFSTECLEHFHHPAQEFEKITALLKPEGLLSIMTELHSGFDQMMNWYYIKDSTHVTFYSEKTMDWIASKYKFKMVFMDHKRVIVFRKMLP